MRKKLSYWRWILNLLYRKITEKCGNSCAAQKVAVFARYATPDRICISYAGVKVWKA